MAYKADCIAISPGPGNGTILKTFRYTSDGQPPKVIEETIARFTDDDGGFAQSRCEYFEKVDQLELAVVDAVKTFTPGPVSLPRDDAGAVAAAEKARAIQAASAQVYQTAQVLSTQKILVDNGVIAADDPAYVAAKTAASDAKAALDAVSLKPGP